MFNEKLLESSEFYSKRYQNFTTLIIFPTLILLLLLIGLASFTHKEVVVRSTGEINPDKILATIQSTSNNAIIKNNLISKKSVRHGDMLIKYQNSETDTTLKLENASLQNLQAREKALLTYKKSLSDDKNLFSESDAYGYFDAFQNYLSQTHILSNDYQQQLDSQNRATQQKNVLTSSLTKKENNLNHYQSLLLAIQNNTNLSSENDYYRIFSDYKDQTATRNSEESASIKRHTISTLQEQIDRLEDAIANYKTQYDSLPSENALPPNTLPDKLSDLKSQQLSTVAKDLSTVTQEMKQIKIQHQATQDSSNNAIISPETGTVKLLVDKTKTHYMPQGTNIAQIYPNLTEKPKLKVTFYINTSEITNISEGQLVRYILSQNNNTKSTLTGHISQIATHSVSTKQGNFYQVDATLHLKHNDYSTVHYGQEGTVSVITGKSTWFIYLKNKLTS
ncbi:bacteriocin secretion accessory protein [Leuconostoc miyukkimchii]|uniref:bacteriocin secretion accessory protein n=1 Tax=Leuconostoc miyukkimchii TaxID=910540 RepID=UPI001C7DFB7A|nr:bacteriocin secretion accessory protein [Leuconostoc miyukkimchii]